MFSEKPIEAAQNQTFLQKLKKLDLEPIVHQLMQSGWAYQQTICAINCYKIFLLLSYLYPHTPLVPTQEIDRVWHCHILHTRKYREDCQMLFGYFIDHEPNFKIGVRNQESGVRRELFSFFVCTRSRMVSNLKMRNREQPESIPLAENLPQQQKLSNKDSLHLHRSACGRPESSLREIFHLSVAHR